MDKTALIGNIGRSGVTFALTDGSGQFREDSVRGYEADRHRTISSALMAFKEDAGLATLPRRCALAVAGVSRGDTVSVTSSRWFVSKSGLAAILQRPPFIINDFAAHVWAVSATEPKNIQPAGAPVPALGPGIFLVIGTAGDGLGVAAFIRNDGGNVTVIPSEAGHSELIDRSPEMAPILAGIRDQSRYCSAETVLSPSGLAAMHQIITQRGCPTDSTASGEEVIKAVTRGDPDAAAAAALFAKALWRFAGNLALIYGAWDGIFLTGKLVDALRDYLCKPENRQSFAIAGPYANLLRSVPAGLFLLDHSALRGAAEAIRQQD